MPPKPKRRATYHFDGDLKQAALERAESLLATDGLGAVSLKRIATQLGVSSPAMYRHFASRDDLLAHVAAAGFEQMTHRYQAAKGRIRAACPEDAVVMVAQLYAQFARERPDHYRLMFTGILPDPLRFDALRTSGVAAFGLMVETVANVRRAHGHTAFDPIADAAELWAALHGLCILRLDDRFGFLDLHGVGKRPEVERLARRWVTALVGTPR